jgi:hypothetical protein
MEALPVAFIPITAVIGTIGACVALVRGRRRTALWFGMAGVGAIVLAVALYYMGA